jgi:hypothetical protein
MKKPRLYPEDIAALRRLTRNARDIDKCDRAGDGAGHALALQALRVSERLATVNARFWWEHVPAVELHAELARWHAEFRWERTSRGWKAYRLIKTRCRYATKPSCTGQSSPEETVWIRL